MISSLALNGWEKQALTMYEKMRSKGLLQPNEITFVAVLSACARVKPVDFGFQLFEAMSREFGLVAKMEHYGCVVYLLGRVGLLQEAYNFIKKMPFEADATVSGALWVLVDFMEAGAIELGNEVAQLLLESQLNHSGRYVQLSCIYAGAKRMDMLLPSEKAVLDAGIHTVPAHSFFSKLITAAAW
ncbi:hypothetical protein MTR67_000450 [Solanum verrucosum]|uniref:Pentatricopeptide repeat-containing protein n=1 Tax=Solanum verrucosum TaxID=315347 RepID=A0AAF0PQ27_SOLVR|nr:hypothetical protein MTR67_000450 [Solanum verrucosum]